MKWDVPKKELRLSLYRQQAKRLLLEGTHSHSSCKQTISGTHTSRLTWRLIAFCLI
jgi:hypothetical protein